VLPDRIENKIKREDCWLWSGCLRPDGYGAVWWDGKKLAHRVVYEIVKGPIEGQLHHECENPACVNPQHLRDVTAQTHRHRHMESTCPSGHRLVGDNVRIRVHRDGRRQRVCVTCNRDAGLRFRARRKEKIQCP